MTMFGFVMMLLGVGTLTSQLLRFIDRVDQPRRRKRHVA